MADTSCIDHNYYFNKLVSESNDNVATAKYSCSNFLKKLLKAFP